MFFCHSSIRASFGFVICHSALLRTVNASGERFIEEICGDQRSPLQTLTCPKLQLHPNEPRPLRLIHGAIRFRASWWSIAA